jgi:KaiC/GvpD/RAD55 family RecA-like ATPase
MAMSLGVDGKMPILKTNRLATGIPDLDMIMEGGYLNPANIILLGPSGNEKVAFGYHFAGAAGKDEVSFVVCGNSSPSDVMKKASTMGIDLGHVHFIDCYTSTLGRDTPPSSETVTVVPGPSALNDISLALNEAMRSAQGKRMRVVFDTLSTFVLYNSKDSIKKFLSIIEGRLRSSNATVLYLVDEGVHDKQLLSLIEHGMDSIYTIVDKGGKFVLILPEVDMGIPIRISPTGVMIQ